MLSVNNIVVCLGDFYEHVGRHIDGFNGVNGGCSALHWKKQCCLCFSWRMNHVCQVHALREGNR